MLARKALYVSALNALIDHGLNVSYDSIGAEERNDLSINHVPQRITCHFDLEGVPCIATCRPVGCGEEHVAVVYNSNDAELAEHLCRVGNSMTYLRAGITAGSFYVERKRGPYIMSTPMKRCNFRYTRLDSQRLRNVVVEPNGFAAEGDFII